MRAIPHKLILCVVLAGILSLGGARGGAADKQFGKYQSTIADLHGPSDVAVGPHDEIYVVETERHRVRVFRPDGTEIRKWGEFGRGDGEFDSPRAIAIGPDGRVYVSDTGNHRIEMFDADGEFRRVWGSHGAGEGQLNFPLGLTIADSHVYVADSRNDRIEVFNLDGRFERAFGETGNGRGKLNRPVDVAVDDSGNVFVSDADNSQVQVFNRDGTFVASWGEWGFFPGLLAEPAGIVYRDRHVYLADLRNHRLEAFGPFGKLQYEWGLHAIRPREGEGKLHYPNTLAIAPSGEFAVVCEFFENRCQIFGLETPSEAAKRFNPLPPGTSSGAHYGPCISIGGSLLAVTEPDAHAVSIYDVGQDTPILINQFGTHGAGPGQFNRPTDVCLDRDLQRLIVCDAGNRRLQEFKLTRKANDVLRYLPDMTRMTRAVDLRALSAKVPELKKGGALTATAIDRDADGNLYVLDARNCLVAVFNERYEFVRAWGGFGDAPGEFREPSDLAFDPAVQTLYVVDAGHRRVQAFDTRGKFKFGFGQRGSGDGEFLEPFGITIAGDGSIYVTDTVADRVQHFTADGEFKSQWGGFGLGAGQFHRPSGIGIDAQQRVIVDDYGNHRGQIFTPEGKFVQAFGARLFVLPTRNGNQP